MVRTAFLVNPASDNGATGRRWPELANRAAALGLRGDVHFSDHPEHLRALARHAVDEGAGLVVAVGGDGTVNEVVNGIIGTNAELAVISRGTGVDFPRTFDIPRRLEDAVRVALEGTVREIDAGRVEFRTWSGDPGEMHFVNVAGVGMSGAVAKRTNESTKTFGGKATYLFSTFAVFAHWKNTEVRVSVDDEIRGGRMHEVIVANGRFLGGGMQIAPDARPDDGLFDVVLFGDVTKRDLVLAMPKIYRGTYLPHPKAELLRGAVVSVESDEPIPVQLDGEQPGTTPVRFEVVPGALRLRVPSPA
jgi:YegS/Rv2252/BmrU family lipid kinase